MSDMNIKDLSQYRGKLALFYDTETTGLPNDAGPLKGQPHVCQLAWQLVGIPADDTQSYDVAAEFQSILKLNDGGIMGHFAEEVHGISASVCAAVGLEPLLVLELFFAALSKASLVVAHNEQFDRKFIGYMYRRLRAVAEALDWYDEGGSRFADIPVACTQELSRAIVQLPPTARMLAVGRRGYKTPKLTEAYTALVGGKLEGAHDAMVDVRGTVSVFEALLDRSEEKTDAS